MPKVGDAVVSMRMELILSLSDVSMDLTKYQTVGGTKSGEVQLKVLEETAAL